MKRISSFILLLLLLAGCAGINEEYLIGGTWVPVDDPKFVQQEQECLPIENGIQFIDAENAITPTDDGRFHYDIKKSKQGEYSVVLLDVVIDRIDILQIDKISKNEFGVIDSNNTGEYICYMVRQ